MTIERISPKSDSYSALLWDVVCNVHHYVPERGDRVLDLGAHFGMFSLYCAARGANVVAVEPSPETFAELRHTAETCEGLGNSIQTINAAVWNSELVGDKPLWISPETTGSNSLVRQIPGREPIWVQTIPLEFLLERNRGELWDCVKVDIEGAEFATFTKTAPESLRLIKFLTMEIHNDILSREQTGELLNFLGKNFPHNQKFHVIKDGTVYTDVATILCWR